MKRLRPKRTTEFQTDNPTRLIQVTSPEALRLLMSDPNFFATAEDKYGARCIEVVQVPAKNIPSLRNVFCRFEDMPSLLCGELLHHKPVSCTDGSVELYKRALKEGMRVWIFPTFRDAILWTASAKNHAPPVFEIVGLIQEPECPEIEISDELFADDAPPVILGVEVNDAKGALCRLVPLRTNPESIVLTTLRQTVFGSSGSARLEFMVRHVLPHNANMKSMTEHLSTGGYKIFIFDSVSELMQWAACSP